VKYGSFADNVVRQVSNSVAAGGLSREADLAIRHGWVKSSQEWFEYATMLDAITNHTQDDDYRRIMPKGMM